MFKRKTTITTTKVVYIGNRPPTDHYVPGYQDPAKRWVHAEELYQPKQRDRRR